MNVETLKMFINQFCYSNIENSKKVALERLIYRMTNLSRVIKKDIFEDVLISREVGQN